MTKEFDKRNAAKSRKVCAAMAEACDSNAKDLIRRARALAGVEVGR